MFASNLTMICELWGKFENGFSENLACCSVISPIREYKDVKESLLHAALKAPVVAPGFWVQCYKWAIIVWLLLGEIPKRTVFMQKGMEKALTLNWQM